MNNPKDPANAAHSAARRQNAALQGHDDARDAIKDLCNRRAKGEPPAQLRARDTLLATLLATKSGRGRSIADRFSENHLCGAKELFASPCTSSVTCNLG